MNVGTYLKTFAVVSTLAMASAASAATLFSQTYDGVGALNSSQNDTSGGNGNFATMYDNFTIGSGGTITGLSFTGGFFSPPMPATITQFTIRFYADTGSQPGAVLATNTIAGNGGQSCGAVGAVATICTYSLAASFAAAAGTQYWMSIVPDIGFPPQWGWATSAQGDDVSYQDFLGDRTLLAGDQAFTLTGDVAGPVVPEPATWALMLSGFGLVGGAMRRRIRANVAYA